MQRQVQQLLTQQKPTDADVAALVQLVKSQKQIIKKLTENTTSFSTRIDGIQEENYVLYDIIQETEARLDEKIAAQPCTSHPTSAPQSDTINQLQSQISSLLSKIESTQVEVNKSNLIIYGVPESESGTESDHDLFSKIAPLLPPTSESSPVTICTSRMGKPRPDQNAQNRPRPVKVTFPNFATSRQYGNPDFPSKARHMQ